MGNKNLKKILFVLPTLSRGGQERVVSRLSFALDDSIYEKYLVLFYKDRIDYPFNGKIISFDLPLPSSSPFKIYQKIFSLFFRIFDLRKVKKKLNPDFAVSFGPEANIVNVFSNLRLKNIKVIVSVRTIESVHFQRHFLFLRWYYNFVIKLVYKLADKIIPNCQAIAEDLIKNFNVSKEKIFIIPNFFDVEKIEDLSKESLEKYNDLFFKNKVIITVGRLDLAKDHESLIKAFRKIKEKFKDTVLVILGEGELENNLRKLVNYLNLEKSVFFLGFQKNPFKFLKNSKIFILPSLYEGFPNVLVEAMVCGIPVIATDCPGANLEILSPNYKGKIEKVYLGEYGILIPPKNPNEIERAISILLENENLKKEYSKKAKLRAKDFSQEKIISQWLEILK